MKDNSRPIGSFDSHTLRRWEQRFETWLVETAFQPRDSKRDSSIGADGPDEAHGLPHIRRVVKTARRLAQGADANLAVVIAAAWLHDCVMVAKNSDQRSQGSRMSADRAVDFLKQANFPDPWLADVRHAIESHSFSAEITPVTIEAKILQDADRLDALGAIGIARCLQTGVALGNPLYDVDDPWGDRRQADDGVSVLDHFSTKLLKLSQTMQTDAGRIEAERRTQFMHRFLQQLRSEID